MDATTSAGGTGSYPVIRLAVCPGARTAKGGSTADIAQAGRQDIVILTTKADDLQDVAPLVREMCPAHTSVVTVQNGLPRWYFLDGGDSEAPTVLKSLDPTGAIGKHIEVDRVVGAFDAGLPLELDATIGVVSELARLTDTPTPLLDAIYASARLRTEGS